MNIRYPLFYFPTSIILLDDNETFLDSVKNFLPLKDNPCFLFSDYYDCLSFVKDKENLLEENIFSLFVESSFSSLNIAQTHVNFEKLSFLNFSEKKKEIISIIVSDYDMDPLNGLDFLREIKNPFVKKVLLTGEADEKIAVEAFNEGIIDAYIDKVEFTRKLPETLEKLKMSFFKEISQTIASSSLEALRLENAYFHTEFCKFLEKTIKENNIKEFYLIEKSGSLICFNESKKTFLFLVKNDDFISSFLEENSDSLDKQTIDQIRSRALIPFFIDRENKENLNIPKSFFNQFLVNSENVIKIDGYYCYFCEAN